MIVAVPALVGLVLLLEGGGTARRIAEQEAADGRARSAHVARAGLAPGEVPVNDGPGAPRPAEALTPSSTADPRAILPEAKERLRREARQELQDLDQEVKKRDWDALREATAAARRAPALQAELLGGEARTPREALAAGLALEELVEDGTLDAAARARLGEALVPLLTAGIAQGGGLGGDERAHALRLLSRFPGEATEDALLRVLDDPASTEEARRHALFGLAEVGGARAAPALRRVFDEQASIDLSRLAAMALHRTAQRLRDAGLAREVALEVRPRVVGWLATLADRDDLFEAVAGTAAELGGVETARFLSTECLDAPLPHGAKALALRFLVASHASSEAEQLAARKGRLGDPALEEMLAAAIEALSGAR